MIKFIKHYLKIKNSKTAVSTERTTLKFYDLVLYSEKEFLGNF